MFCLWYIFSPLISSFVSIVIYYPVEYLTHGLVSNVYSAGLEVEAVVKLVSGDYGNLRVPRGQTAEVVLTARPMIYGYGIPLFATLLFVFYKNEVTVVKVIVCFFILLMGVCFGVAMELMKNIFLALDKSITESISIAQWKLELIAIGYQFSTLILPAMLPLSLWILLNKNYFSDVFES
jgi:hypothetical protein